MIAHDNKLYLYKILERSPEGTVHFSPQAKFTKEAREFKLPDAYKEIIDLFIFKDPASSSTYSMYVVSTNGILCYENIDRKDRSHINEGYPISNDLLSGTLTMGAIDCNSEG